MQRSAQIFELVTAYFAIGTLMVMAAGTMTPPVGGTYAAAATAGCTAPSFSKSNITAASLYTPWSVPLLSAIEDASFPKVAATGLPPGIALKDQTTKITTGVGTTLHTWVLEGAPTQLGTYTITVTAQNSCGGASTIITLPINNTVSAQGTVACPAGYTGTYPNCVASTANVAVAFDKETLVATTSTATITGTSRTSFVRLNVKASSGSSYDTGTTAVAGGRWAITLQNLKTGVYSLFLYDGNNTPLVPATLTVAVPGTSAQTTSGPVSNVLTVSSNAVPVAYAPSCAQISSTLSLGARGNDVLLLQAFLIQKGLLAQGSATGYYGAQTRSAVQQFQISQGIVSSGSEATTGFGAVGMRTRAAIAAGCASTYTPPTSTTVQPVTSLPSCPKISVPPCQGGTLISLGADTNHCSLGYVCQQSVGSNCPRVEMPICSGGTLVSNGTDYNGCSMGYSCQKLICPTVTQITCQPGQTIVSAPDANGCPTISYCTGTPTQPICLVHTPPICAAGQHLETQTGSDGCKSPVCVPDGNSSGTISGTPTSGSLPLTVAFSYTGNTGAPAVSFGDGQSGTMNLVSSSQLAGYGQCNAYESTCIRSYTISHTYTSGGSFKVSGTAQPHCPEGAYCIQALVNLSGPTIVVGGYSIWSY